MKIVSNMGNFKEKNSRTTTSTGRKLLGKTTVPIRIHTSAYCIYNDKLVLGFYIYFFLHFNVQSQNFNFIW